MRALLCRLVIGVIGVTVSSRGVARADDNREAARREFTAGQDADKKGDWQSAIEHYLRANDLVPHPFALFNIATDYEKLGQLREAGTWYQRYLAAAPSSEDRAKVERTLADLVARPAKLTVISTPPDAKVFVDREPVGVTPVTTIVHGGAHNVVVERDGARGQKNVTIEYGEPSDLSFTFVQGGTPVGMIAGPQNGPTTGVVGNRRDGQTSNSSLVVVASIQGAAIRVDGQPAGVSPNKVFVTPGMHSVTVEAVGYVPATQQVDIPDGQTKRIDPVLSLATPLANSVQPLFGVGYMAGITGGADIRGTGGIEAVDLGIRFPWFGFLLRMGSSGEGTMIDGLFTWSLTQGRLQPIIGAGFAHTGNDTGFGALAGLRLNLTAGGGVSLLGEVELRSYTVTDSMGIPSTQLMVPASLSLEVMYR